MTKSRAVNFLVGALICFSACSLPRTSHAVPVYGTWTGIETFDTQVYSNGQLVSDTSGSNVPATFSTEYYDFANVLSVSINALSLDGYYSSSPFGADSASGTLLVNSGYFGYNVGNFALSYQSILPNGQIDVGAGMAVADITIIDVDGNGNGEIDFASFQSIPEPSAIVLAATAVPLIVFLAWRRGFRPWCSTETKSGISPS